MWIRLAKAGPPAWVCSPLMAYRVHPSNSSLNVGEIVRGAQLIEELHATRIDWGRIHRWLAESYLRVGCRKEALGQFARAAVRGQAGGVASDVTAILRRRIRVPQAAASRAERRCSGGPGLRRPRRGSESWMPCMRRNLGGSRMPVTAQSRPRSDLHPWHPAAQRHELPVGPSAASPGLLRARGNRSRRICSSTTPIIWLRSSRPCARHGIPLWGTFGSDLPDQLYAGIGEGLVSFLWADRHRRLVTKSPSVRHLARFFAFFPSARLLILVRDGRSVVQSGMDTFGWDFDRGCRAWSEAASTIRHFQQAEAARADRWRLVRYEDLVDDTEGQLRRIFEFLGLDPALRLRGCAQPAGSRVVGVRPQSRASIGMPWRRTRRSHPRSGGARGAPHSWSASTGSPAISCATFGYTDPPARTSVTRSMKHALLDWRWSVATIAYAWPSIEPGCAWARLSTTAPTSGAPA